MPSDKPTNDLDHHFQLLVLFHFKINVVLAKNKIVIHNSLLIKRAHHEKCVLALIDR